jgi:Cof subfamily protein (haloacid dehalogenase superfamily)
VTAISLVVSDVDGTLVTPDKQLTAASIDAVRRLHTRGIRFTICSSRPLAGVRMLVDKLALTLPMGLFNGAVIARPDLSLLEQHLVPEAAARRSINVLSRYGAAVWVFTTEAWLLRDPATAYVALEQKTIQAAPEVVADFAPYLGRAAKIVGSAADFERLSRCEAELRQALGPQASVMRSQPYYLDVTAPNVDKGTALESLSRSIGVASESIAVLGDMDNDLSMFRKAGLRIAMGNASAAVQHQADCVTGSNRDDGFAQAVERYILSTAPREKTA